MTFDERFDRLMQSIEASDRQIAANNEQIARNSDLIAKSSEIIAASSELIAANGRQIAAQGKRIDGLIHIAQSHQEDLRVLLEVTTRQVESTRSLERQWQAYLNTLPRQ